MHGAGTVARPTIQDRLVEAFVDGRHGEVVVQELGVLHHHEGVSRMQIADVWVDCGGNRSGRW